MNGISANIKRARSAKGMSQEQLAQKLHVTRQTVSAWERGISLPGVDMLGEIAQALDIKTETLLYGPQEGENPRYRRISFLPVLWAPIIFYIVLFWILPGPMIWLFGDYNETTMLLGGQIFLSMLMIFLYCSLKDEIRNRDYYNNVEIDNGESAPSKTEKED